MNIDMEWYGKIHQKHTSFPVGLAIVVHIVLWIYSRVSYQDISRIYLYDSILFPYIGLNCDYCFMILMNSNK